MRAPIQHHLGNTGDSVWLMHLPSDLANTILCNVEIFCYSTGPFIFFFYLSQSNSSGALLYCWICQYGKILRWSPGVRLLQPPSVISHVRNLLNHPNTCVISFWTQSYLMVSPTWGCTEIHQICNVKQKNYDWITLKNAGCREWTNPKIPAKRNMCILQCTASISMIMTVSVDCFFINAPEPFWKSNQSLLSTYKSY